MATSNNLDYCRKESCLIFKDYCIIGAGPSGLQMGYFLENSNRDYMVFDKADKAGNNNIIFKVLTTKNDNFRFIFRKIPQTPEIN